MLNKTKTVAVMLIVLTCVVVFFEFRRNRKAQAEAGAAKTTTVSTEEAAIKDDPTAAYPYKNPISTLVWVGVATVCVLALCIYLYVRFRKK